MTNGVVYPGQLTRRNPNIMKTRLLPPRLLPLQLLLILLLVATMPVAAMAQAPDPSFAGAYKAWTTTPEGRGIDSTLYLNIDGSALLIDDPLLGEAASTRTGQWSPTENGVVLTLTGDAAGPLPQPLVVTLDASAGQPLVTLPGDATLDARGRRYYTISYLVENRDALPHSAEFASSTIASNGLAGVYKAIVPGGTSGRLDLTLTLFPDFRVILERDPLDGRAPSLTYGAWQDVGGQAVVTLTEADGVAFRTPAEVTFGVENGALRGLTTASSNAADLVGVPFYRLEGLANAVTVPLPQEISAPPEGEEGAPIIELPAPEPASLPEAAPFVMQTTSTLMPSPVEIVAQYEPSFAAAPCPNDIQLDAAITCGFLTVQENRGRADSQSIQLFVVKLAAPGEDASDPLVVLAGAPGDDPSPLVQWFATAPVRETRSVFILHPRGVGLSEPSLACPEYAADGDPQVMLQSLADCYNRLLQEGRDLAGYSLEQRAIDVADLAQVLALEEINLLGNDVGAAVAQLVAERYPALVRSIVLESPLPAGVNRTLESAFGANDALRKVFADCERDSACTAAYPDLEARFLQMIEWYNQNPTPASIGFGDGDAIAALIFARLQKGGGDIPALIHALYSGDFGTACQIAPVPGGCLLPGTSSLAPGSNITATDTLTESPSTSTTAGVETTMPDAPQAWRDYFVNPDAPQGIEEAALARLQRELGIETRDELIAFLDTLAVQSFLPLLAATGASPQPPAHNQGALLTILCAEDAPWYTIDDIQRIRRRLPAQVASLLAAPAEELLLVCPLWLTPPAANGDRIMQVSAAPALIMAGAYDPVTPARWARRSGADFSQPFVRIFAGQGHNLLQTPDGCAQQMLAAFVARPDQAPNPYCYLRLRPTFTLPAP